MSGIQSAEPASLHFENGGDQPSAEGHRAIGSMDKWLNVSIDMIGQIPELPTPACVPKALRQAGFGMLGLSNGMFS